MFAAKPASLNLKRTFMKTNLYPSNVFSSFLRKVNYLPLFLLALLLVPKAKAQELVFKNSSLYSGSPGQDGTIYKFPSVTPNVNAMVKIVSRSHSQVKLLNIDLTSSGFDRAFQPQVTWNNNTTPSGNTEWWMEFEVSFVNAANGSPVNVASFQTTAIDIDGNGDKISEWVGFYGLNSYAVEAGSLLQYGSISEILNSVTSVVGTRFNGPVTNFTNIDTTSTSVMATATYVNKNVFKIRTGGKSSGSNGAADRMYSLWFKSFNYNIPVQLGLPVTLRSFTANLVNKKPLLNWVSSKEENLNMYVLERSLNGKDYSDVVYHFANGNTNSDSKYSYSDIGLPSSIKGIVYYRLRMVDIDGAFRYSETRMVRFGDFASAAQIAVYPNPALAEIRITLPDSWQQRPVQLAIYSVTGQTMKQITRATASQTETLDISSLPAGAYFVKASSGEESSMQRIVKSK